MGFHPRPHGYAEVDPFRVPRVVTEVAGLAAYTVDLLGDFAPRFGLSQQLFPLGPLCWGAHWMAPALEPGFVQLRLSSACHSSICRRRPSFTAARRRVRTSSR